MNSWPRSHISMECGIHPCPRKCHNPQDHKDLECAVRVKMELPCGHSVSRRCGQSKAPDLCFKCEVAQRKAGLDKASEEREAGTSDRSPTPTGTWSPTSPTSSRRDRDAAATTDNGTWRNGRSADHSTNIFSMYRGSRQSTDAHKDGLFGKPTPQQDSFYPSRGGFRGRGWRK